MKNESFNTREAMELADLSKIRTFRVNFLSDVKFIKNELRDGNIVYVVENKGCYMWRKEEMVKYAPYYDEKNW